MPSNLSDEDLNFLQKDKDLLTKNPANKGVIIPDIEEDKTTNYIEPEEPKLTDDNLPTAREADITPRNL